MQFCFVYLKIIFELFKKITFNKNIFINTIKVLFNFFHRTGFYLSFMFSVSLMISQRMDGLLERSMLAGIVCLSLLSLKINDLNY